MGYRTDQIALTRAGLADRGFHDLLRDGPHTDAVRAAVVDGLGTHRQHMDAYLAELDCSARGSAR